MKKITALLLALVMLTFAFASCGGDKLDGKTFTYEKVEVEFENKEAEEFANKLLGAGQSFGDYFAKNMFGDELKEAAFSFKDGKMHGSFGGELTEEGVAYKLDGKKITFEGVEDAQMDETTFTYEDGKVVLTVESEIPTGLNTKSTITLKVLFAEK